MGAALNLDKEISHYLGHLDTQKKELVVSIVKTFAYEENDWWDTVEGAASEYIKTGLKQAKEGYLIPHEGL